MTRRLMLAIILLVTAVAAATGTGWTHFVSTKYRFSTWYPPGWQPLTPGSQFLEVIDFPQSERVEGAVIPMGGALIQVWPADAQGKTIEDLILQQEKHDGVISPTVDQTLLTGMPYPDSPRTLRQVEYYRNVGAPTEPILQHVTMYYCKVHARVFAVMLIYFRGNTKAKLLEGAARSVARDLRIEK